MDPKNYNGINLGHIATGLVCVDAKEKWFNSQPYVYYRDRFSDMLKYVIKEYFNSNNEQAYLNFIDKILCTWQSLLMYNLI